MAEIVTRIVVPVQVIAYCDSGECTSVKLTYTGKKDPDGTSIHECPQCGSQHNLDRGYPYVHFQGVEQDGI